MYFPPFPHLCSSYVVTLPSSVFFLCCQPFYFICFSHDILIFLTYFLMLSYFSLAVLFLYCDIFSCQCSFHNCILFLSHFLLILSSLSLPVLFSFGRVSLCILLNLDIVILCFWVLIFPARILPNLAKPQLQHQLPAAAKLAER